MSKPEQPEANREKENMSEPQEEFLADSPHELPPQAHGRTGAHPEQDPDDAPPAARAKTGLQTGNGR